MKNAETTRFKFMIFDNKFVRAKNKIILSIKRKKCTVFSAVIDFKQWCDFCSNRDFEIFLHEAVAKGFIYFYQRDCKSECVQFIHVCESLSQKIFNFNIYKRETRERVENNILFFELMTNFQIETLNVVRNTN